MWKSDAFCGTLTVPVIPRERNGGECFAFAGNKSWGGEIHSHSSFRDWQHMQYIGADRLYVLAVHNDKEKVSRLSLADGSRLGFGVAAPS